MIRPVNCHAIYITAPLWGTLTFGSFLESIMVSCHWQVSSLLSHTATFSSRHGAVWVRVVSYEDEDLVRPEEGDLVSMLGLLRTRRYNLTTGILTNNVRLDPRDPVTSARILNIVLATMQEGGAGMTFLQALRKIRPLIANSRMRYICWSLEFEDASEHKPRIMGQLQGCETYETWVYQHHNDVYRKMEEIGRAAFQQGRLAWIDHMIAQELAP